MHKQEFFSGLQRLGSLGLGQFEPARRAVRVVTGDMAAKERIAKRKRQQAKNSIRNRRKARRPGIVAKHRKLAKRR